MSKKIKFSINLMIEELKRLKKEKGWQYVTEWSLYDEVLENSIISGPVEGQIG